MVCDMPNAYHSCVFADLCKNTDVGVEGDEPIPLPNVDSSTLTKVIEWCTYHADDPEPFVDDFEDEFEVNRSVTICPWDQQFYNVEHEILFDIILAANYLDIKLRESRIPL